MRAVALQTMVWSRAIQFDAHLMFPALLLVLNVGAALVSCGMGDYKRATYWFASAVCIAMVAF